MLKKAREYIPATSADCRCIRGRQGSWVRFGPMDEEDLRECGTPFFNLRGELISKWMEISGGFLVVCVVYVNVEGHKVVREWDSIGDPAGGATASPFKQNKLFRYFK